MSREILGEVKELRKDLKSILDERLARMERDIAEIKAKLGLLSASKGDACEGPSKILFYAERPP